VNREARVIHYRSRPIVDADSGRARRTRDEGDVNALGQQVTDEVVDVLLETADAVERPHGTGGERDAERTF
jgi:hypothetical protein